MYKPSTSQDFQRSVQDGHRPTKHKSTKHKSRQFNFNWDHKVIFVRRTGNPSNDDENSNDTKMDEFRIKQWQKSRAWWKWLDAQFTQIQNESPQQTRARARAVVCTKEDLVAWAEKETF